jgi:phosphoglycerate kinase
LLISLKTAKMITITDYDFKGKKAIIRVDFNVPLDKLTFNVLDDKRIRAALPTIKYILGNGGAVILMTHFGRPKNGPEQQYSVKNILAGISELVGLPVQFASDCISDEAISQSKSLQPGEVLLLENVRFYKEETAGSIEFAQKLSRLGDCFVNDAFGAAHRAHASTTQIASFFPTDKMMGFLMKAEIENAQKVLTDGKKPFTAIIGGAKVSDKILIVENLLSIADHIIIGGGMAYTFIKALGGNIGNSICEVERIPICLAIIEKAKLNGVQIHLPIDSVIADEFSPTAKVNRCLSNDIPDGWMGLDIGEKSSLEFENVLSKSKTILWNGPMGVFEMESFCEGTKSMASAVASATKNGSFSLIGGGDSAAAVLKFGFEDEVSYISTGGGALLEYFEGKELPGITALAS